MDTETKKSKKHKSQAASRSSDALTQNTPKAASSDAPLANNPRAASQDAPTRQPPKAASSDAPNTQKRSAAPKDAVRKAIARDAPQRVASQALPTSSASMDAPPNTTLTERPRTVLAHGDSRSTANVDAPKTRVASTAATSERDLTRLAEAPRAGTSNANNWQTVFNKKTFPKAVSAAADTPTGEAATGAKRKRSTRPRGRKKQQKSTMGPPARAQKRSRPEDSVTPTGISKKSKPARSHMVDGSLVSYAETAASFRNNELCVAVMTEPFMDLTQEQAEGIRQTIEDHLRALLKAVPEPATTTQNTAIHFRGRAHYAEGVLKTWCEDDFTLAWLKGFIQNTPSPLPGTKLTVRPQADIPKKALCVLYVPENSEDTTDLLGMLARQNPNLKMNTWTLTHARVNQEPPSTCLFFRVPESLVKIIKDQQRRVYYLMGSIYIRFLKEGGTKEDAAVPSTSTTSAAPGVELEPPPPEHSPTPLAMGMAGEAVELATSMAALEVESTKGPTQDPPSSGLTSDEECFPTGERSEDEDSNLCSSPLRDD